MFTAIDVSWTRAVCVVQLEREPASGNSKTSVVHCDVDGRIVVGDAVGAGRQRGGAAGPGRSLHLPERPDTRPESRRTCRPRAATVAHHRQRAHHAGRGVHVAALDGGAPDTPAREHSCEQNGGGQRRRAARGVRVRPAARAAGRASERHARRRLLGHLRATTEARLGHCSGARHESSRAHSDSGTRGGATGTAAAAAAGAPPREQRDAARRGPGDAAEGGKRSDAATAAPEWHPRGGPL